MKRSSIRQSMLFLLAILAVFAFGTSVQAKLFVRFTFNEHEPGVDPNDSSVANSGHNINVEAYDATVHTGDLEEFHPTYVGSPGGAALHLDGSLKQFVLLHFPGVPGDTLPPSLSEGMSVAYWLRFETTSDGYMSLLTTISSNSGPFDQIRHTLRYPSTGVAPYQQRRFQCPYTLPPGDETIFSAGEWHHLAWTLEGDPGVPGSQTMKYFLDGDLKYTATNATMRVGTNTASRIGVTWIPSVGYKEAFSGDLDQVDIYDHTLSDEEVLGLYQAGALVRKTGQVWIRTNPPLLAGQFVVAAEWHAVDTATEMQDFIDAGFNYFGYFDPTDKITLDLLKNPDPNDLGVDPNFPIFAWSTHDTGLQQLRPDYGADFPTVIMRGDEPYAPEDLAKWANQTKFIKDHYPEYLVMTNANGITGNHPLNDPNYFQRFVDVVQPDVLMSDRYPLATNGTTDFGYYFDMLAEMRKVALVNDLPLWVWVQSETLDANYVAINGRLPSETDLRMMMFSAETFGFTGFNYLSYAHWTVDAVIDSQGNHTHVYQSAQNTNPEVRRLAETLRFAKSSGIFYVPGQPGNTVPEYHGPIDLAVWSAGADPDDHIQDVSIDENATLINGLIGFFTADDGQEYFMNCNLFSGPGLSPVDAEVTFRVQFDASVSSLLRINRLTGAQVVVALAGNELVDVLPGGTGNLYKYNNGVDFMTEWLGPEPMSCIQAIYNGYGLDLDFNNDCYVDMLDLTLLFQNWMSCIEPGDPSCTQPWL